MPLVNEPNETYHAHPAFSKSKLWRYHTMTPYRAEFGKVEEKSYYLFGQAGHIAVLEPERLDTAVIRGPEARGNSNEWKHAAEEAKAAGAIILKPEDYDAVMMMRDLANRHPFIRKFQDNPIIETSCYAIDEETGAEVKCRPDCYTPSLGGMMDVKFLASIEDADWSRDIGTYGYHMQDAMYLDVWNKGSGHESDFMAFACISKTEPPEIVVRQLTDIDVEEGYKAYRAALEVAHRCRQEGNWPGKPLDVIDSVMMRDQHRRFTEPQWRKETPND